jgi:hypothetical protein
MAAEGKSRPVTLSQAHQFNIEVAGAPQLRTTDGDMLQNLNAHFSHFL